MTDSRISGFHRMSIDERLTTLLARGIIDEAMARQLRQPKGMLSPENADRMVENVIGVFGLPLSVAPNFLVNGTEYVVPMVVEEPSVVAAVSAAARLVRRAGGFIVTSTDPVSIGQIHLCNLADADAVIARLRSAEHELTASANALQPRLVARGGGVVGLEIRKLQLPQGRHAVVLHLLVDTRDAMGANTVNSLCEGIAPEIEALAGAKASLRILSNLADRSMMTASATIPFSSLGADGQTIAHGIVLANEIALADPYRAATHNKGIMNGMDAVAIATGNDWRALEAGAHAYAARDGNYRALTSWRAVEHDQLHGALRMPVRMGIVGGSLHSNPAAVAGLCIAGVSSSQELGELMCAVGLAQNFAALKALAGDGIQQGHMQLHARSVALAAGVPRRHSDRIVRAMIESGEIKEWKARQLLAESASGACPVAGTPLGSGLAAGKIILLGEHAVVYGRPALALPVRDAIGVSLYDNENGFLLKIPAWNIEQTISSMEAEVDGAMALLQFLVRRLVPRATGMHVEVDAGIPPAAGLGSSAALAVALIRAISSAFCLGLDDSAVNELAFECEKLSHGTPSGIDNTLAVYDQTILYEKGSGLACEQLVLTENPPLVIAYSGMRGSTREQVDGVRHRYRLIPDTYNRIFDEIGRISREGAAALVAGDYPRLGSLMNVCQGLLNALQVSTPLIEEMIDIARSSGALGAKLTGAGGGGSIVALCPGKVEVVSSALASSGFEVICLDRGDPRQA